MRRTGFLTRPSNGTDWEIRPTKLGPMRTAIARFLQFLAVERNASAYTVKSYREDLTALADYLTELRDGQAPSPGDVTVLDLRGYVSALSESGYAKSSIARHLASLRSFFRFGQREGWANTNPAKPLRNPRKGRTLPHFLSAEDLGKLFEAPPSDEPMGLRDRAILETMYSAGLRVSEAVGLDDTDLDFAAGVLRVRGKGRRERLAPVGSYATRALRRWLQVRGGERVSGTFCRNGPEAGTDAQRWSSHKRFLTPFPRPVFVNKFRAATHHAKRRPNVGEVSEGDWSG